jgi:hypothetical protein
MGKLYETYFNYPAGEVPREHLKIMLTDFIIEAGVDMGQKPDDAIYDRVVYFATTDFKFMKMVEIASVIKRGALGQLSAGRIVPKTIYIWLSETRNESLNKSGAADKVSMDKGFRDYVNYPLGQAIMKKIDWYQSGAIDGNDWDKIPLKELALSIGKGHIPHLIDFGIYPKNE